MDSEFEGQIEGQLQHAIAQLHRRVADGMQTQLGDLLSVDVSVSLTGVESLSLSEFLFSIQHPSFVVAHRPMPLQGIWLLEIPSCLHGGFIDGLLGSWAKNQQDLEVTDENNELTEVEQYLMHRLADSLKDAVERSWGAIAGLKLEEFGSATNQTTFERKLAHAINGREACLAIELAVTLAQVASGSIRLCLPSRSIEPFHARLIRRFFEQNEHWEHREQWHEERTTLIANLARSKIKAADVLDLQVGDVITTEQAVESAIEVELLGVGKLEGRAGIHNHAKAVEVTKTPNL